MKRFYLQRIRSGYIVPTGNPIGYETFDEAKAAAERRVTNSGLDERIRILMEIAYVSLDDNNQPYVVEDAA
jgi:hypothetical protein